MKKKNEMQDCRSIRLIHGGKEFFSLLKQLIREAEKSIHLQTYIFKDDKTGSEIADQLIEAALRKVNVFVLVDGYASQSLPLSFIDRMRMAGVRFRFFEPLLKGSHFYFGRRLHHKLVVTDEQHAIVCGLNIDDRYNDLPEQKAWLDLGVYVSGTIAGELAQICRQIWNKEIKIAFKSQIRPSSSDSEKQCYLRICRNDWVMGKHEIYQSYNAIIRNANKSITILCSYFLPDRLFRRKLEAAVKKGVVVKIVLAGFSDLLIVKQAERYLYRWMLRNKILIYEYQPTVLHAKIALADGEVMTIGSYNINNLSANASIELNLEIKEKDFVQEVNSEIEKIIREDCCLINPAKKINIFSLNHLIQLISYNMIQLLLMVSTFYFKKKE